MVYKLFVKMVGSSIITPRPPKTTIALRAAPSDHPRLIRRPDNNPPTRLPRSAAINGIQIATKVLLRSSPFATR